jgi:acyl carrier protein
MNRAARAADEAALQARIRKVLREHARLRGDVEALSEDDDLYQAGMSSHATVNVMLALESEFDLEFPDQMLNRSLFDSIGNIAGALEQIGVH